MRPFFKRSSKTQGIPQINMSITHFYPLADMDSLTTQARHYKTLQEMYKKTKPNQDAVSHILDLEFQARQAFIDSNALKEEERTTKILDAYPCFKELHNVSNTVVFAWLQRRHHCRF